MTNDERQTSEASGGAAAGRSWEPMSLTKVGSFVDVLKGATGTPSDGGATKRPL